jgi:5,10-methylene-tetrahydrofolate dehydrogenase/methenyl tetrahydrofolate cyclohydrolase
MTLLRLLFVKFPLLAICLGLSLTDHRGATALTFIHHHHHHQQQRTQRIAYTCPILGAPSSSIRSNASCGSSVRVGMVATDDTVSSSTTADDATITSMHNNSYAGVDIPGKAIATTIQQEIKEQIETLVQGQGQRPPGLAVILVGSRRDSQTYVNMKTKACAQVGIVSHQVTYDEETVTQQQVIDKVMDMNADPAIHGILIQLPLPDSLDQDVILQSVDPNKDVDGLHPVNVARLAMLATSSLSRNSNLQKETSRFPIPCTPLGCMELLVRSGVDIAGKHAVVIGRSKLVGLPMSRLLLAADATVTMVHSKTQNMEEVVRQGDIVVAAVGKPCMVKKEWLKPGAVVIDVGINSVDITPKKPGGKAYKLVGDVDHDNAKQVCSLITPVPGGVGPMTIAMLLRNTVASWQRSQSQTK